MTATEALAEYMESLGIGTVGSLNQWGIFCLSIPAAAHDDAIGVYPAGGYNAEETLAGVGPFEYPQFDIQVRSKDAKAAETKAVEIWTKLYKDWPGAQLLQGLQWQRIKAFGNIRTIGPDANARARIACSYLATKRIAS